MAKLSRALISGERDELCPLTDLAIRVRDGQVSVTVTPADEAAAWEWANHLQLAARPHRTEDGAYSGAVDFAGSTFNLEWLLRQLPERADTREPEQPAPTVSAAATLTVQTEPETQPEPERVGPKHEARSMWVSDPGETAGKNTSGHTGTARRRRRVSRGSRTSLAS